MQLLIAGLILFLAAHSTRIDTEGLRIRIMDRLGEKPWKGLIALISIVGFVMIIIGYGEARLAAVPLWTPPFWTRHLALLLNLLAFLLLTAAYVPRNILKAKIGHPMVAGVKIWALAHLISNGTLADMLLFGSFLIWSVLDFRSSRRRDRLNEVSYPSATVIGTMSMLAIGSLLWFVFVNWLHLRWVGVSPLGI